MKRLCVFIVLLLMLAGCSTAEQFEKLEGTCCTQDVPAPGTVSITATDEMSAPVISTENSDRLYITDDYMVTLQTLPGGDLAATLKSCTGFERDKLTVVETQKDGMKRYDCAWTAAGEGSQSVGRTTVLEDSAYHYVLTVSAPGANAEAMTQAWQKLAESFSVNIEQ